MNIKIKSHDYHLINIYMPHVNVIAEEVVHKIRIYLDRTKEESTIILGEDWNTTLSENDRRNCTEIRRQLVSDLKTLLSQYRKIL